MRTLAIWATGLVAFALFGSMVGFALAGNRTVGEGVGAVAGASLFICLRLWFAKPSGTQQRSD